MIQLTKTGIRRQGTEADFSRLRREFETRHSVVVRHFIEPDFLKEIQRATERASFYTRLHSGYHFSGKGIGREYCMKTNSTFLLLRFLANDPKLFRWVRRLTGCAPIHAFMGRVYRMSPARKHFIDWHSDLSREGYHEDKNNRMIAMSVNLSPEVFHGGSFQLRDARTKKMIRRFTNNGFGDAIFFRISRDLEHSVTDLEEKTEKTAFVGWFTSPCKTSHEKGRCRCNGFSLLDQFVSETAGGSERIDFDAPFRIKGISRRSQGGTIVVDPSARSFCRLDTMAGRVWKLMGKSRTLSEVCVHLSKEYRVPQETIRSDLRSLAGSLAHQRLLIFPRRRGSLVRG